MSLATALGACAPWSPPAPPVPAPPSLNAIVQEVLDRAVGDSAFPGAIAVVGSARGVLVTASSGQLDARDSSRPTLHTLWDLASLTKVVVTTTAVLQQVERGAMALDSPLVRYLPEWTAAGADRVTVRQLLTHRSGLPAWRPLFRDSPDARAARDSVLATSPDSAARPRFVYSDLGFMLLGWAVERVTAQQLDTYAAQEIFRPLGMGETMFRPDSQLMVRIAPTEVDTGFRLRQLRGEVHDENAFHLGGVSGHAGLFSSAHDLTRFARMLLNGGQLDSVRVLGAPWLVAFTTVDDPAVSHRAQGWETPNGTNSAGTQFSPWAFGHTGFTGTSLWVDPVQDLFILLLSNRVNPTRDNRRISGVRAELADRVVLTRRALDSLRFLEAHTRRR